jgi:TPR repeat protein
LEAILSIRKPVINENRVQAMRFELPVTAEERAKRRAMMPEWTAAASAGRVDAQLALAWEYSRGDAIDQDIVEAWHWFERAAASGQDEALAHHARFLQLRGVPEGVRQLRDLAARKNWKAQFWLAQYYQSRRGRINQLRAVVWYDRSFKNGNRVANLGKLAQLTRIAHLPWKIAYAARAILEVARIIRQGGEIETYEPLLYRLKSKS